MKLIYIANLRLPTEKAYGIQIAKMCEAFALKGANLTLIWPYRKNKVEEDFFDYYSIKRNYKIKVFWAPDIYFTDKYELLNIIIMIIKNFFSALTLAFYALFKKSDIIFSRDELIVLFLSVFKKKIIYEPHRFSKRRKFFYWIFKIRKVKIAAITYRFKDDFMKIGFKPEDVLVAPDGVNINEFAIDISKETAREKTNLPLDKKIVMYAGHLFEWKGANVLAKAAELINDALFVFVGGTERDVHNFRVQYGDKENIKIVGFKLHNEIPVYLKAADVLILPNSAKEEISRHYTSPLKMFEYMASQRPIVASDLPSLREVLNGANAVLVEPDDPEKLAAGIRKILNDSNLGNRISDKAFSDVQDYTWEKRAEEILNFTKR